MEEDKSFFELLVEVMDCILSKGLEMKERESVTFCWADDENFTVEEFDGVDFVLRPIYPLLPFLIENQDKLILSFLDQSHKVIVVCSE